MTSFPSNPPQQPPEPDEIPSSRLFQRLSVPTTTTTRTGGANVPSISTNSQASSSPAINTPSTSSSPSASGAPALDLLRDTIATTSQRPADARGYAEASGSDPRSLTADDIEMEPITPAGHRRRRSSLLNSHGQNPGAGMAAATHEPKILEEDRDDGSEAGDLLSEEDLHDDEETGLTKRHRLRKREKRRRNTRLDQRIVRDDGGGGGGGSSGGGVGGGAITEEERKEADKNVVRRLAINAGLILLWYIFSLGISIYNKWMFDSKQLDFRFPMFTTSVHMLIQFSLSCVVLYFVPSLRPGNAGRRQQQQQQQQHMSDMGQSRHEAEHERGRPIMTKMFYLTRIGPCGAATGLDIGLGNTSLKFITLTFYTMCKSSSLAFVLLFAFLFRLETPTWRLVAIIATMTAGVVMMVAGEVEFKLGGFVLVISAAFFSGFRWGLTQILLLRNPATSNPFASVFFLAPVMFVTLFSIAVPVEGIPELLEGVRALSEARGPIMAPVIVLFPGAIAFLMTVSEFALLQRTSVVTLSIAGIFKEVVTISAAALVFGDSMTPVNVSGLLVTLAAICAYNYIKITRMREDARASAHRARMDHGAVAGAGEESASASSSGGSGSDAEGETDREDVALLRRSIDANPGDGGGGDGLRFTADGEIVPKLEGSDGLRPAEHRQRED